MGEKFTVAGHRGEKQYLGADPKTRRKRDVEEAEKAWENKPENKINRLMKILFGAKRNTLGAAENQGPTT